MTSDRRCTGRVAACALVSLVLASNAVALAGRGPPPVVAQGNWKVEVVDAGNYVGYYNSLALDSMGRPHIAYFARGNGTLPQTVRYATRVNGSWLVQTLGPVGDSEGGPAIAMDAADRPWIAYPWADAARTQFDLRVAHWNETAWQFQTVEPVGVEAGWWPSLALDRQDRPHVAYYSNVTGYLQLAYAEWDGTQWLYQTVFRSAQLNLGKLPTWHPISLKLDSLGSPRIAESGNATLTYFARNGTQWQAEFPAPIPGDESVSLALDSRDQPHIAYYESTATNPRYVHWDGTTWVRETPVSFGSVGWGLSLVLDPSDQPRISYGHGLVANPPMYYAYYVSKSAGVWGTQETVDSTERAVDTSLALDFRGLPRMSYAIGLNSTCCELRYAFVPWVDTAPPASQVLPISPYWNGNPVTATATDESGLANVTLWYRHSGDNLSWGAWTAFGTLANPPWAWSFPYPAGDGYYGFYTTAVDVVGNVEPPPSGPDAIAGYDATPPVSSALPVTPYWYASRALTVNGSANDALSGVASVTLLYAYAPDNATWRPWSALGTLTAPPWAWSFPFPDGEGHYRLHTIARDVAGNVEGNKTAAEAIVGYRVPPDYAPANPSPPTPITVGLSFPVTFSLEVANLGGTAHATATLAFFNVTTPGAPFATFPVPPVLPGRTVGPFAVSWLSPAAPGTYAVAADVDHGDALAESNKSNNLYAWTIDVVSGPATALVVGQPNVRASVLYVTSATPLSLSVFDPGGTGVRATRYQVDGSGWIDYGAPFALPTEGEHVIEWFSEDNAGNLEGVRSATVRVDDTPPVTTPSPGSGRYPAGTTFEFSALDAGSGVARTEVRVDGGAWTPYAGPLVLALGDHTIGFRSVDRLNNTEAERTLAVKIAGAPPVPETNWKPLVALVFSIILVLAGAASARRAPWPRGPRRRLRAFLLVVLPFVAAEGATGVVSLITGLLAIPPLLGVGTTMDVAILVSGVAVSLFRIRTRTSSVPSPKKR